MIDFVRLFAPHVSARKLDEVRRARSQNEINELFSDTELPLRGGCADGVIEAA
jgi:hypothetical protein